MYGVSALVNVIAVTPNERIVIDWPADGPSTSVEWRFSPGADDTTFVSIMNSGFSGDGDDAVQQAIEATEAFALVLSGLKAFLEHGIALNLIADRFPEGFAER
jgi:uncharacterized protein YndB with AHSA1/START domain